MLLLVINTDPLCSYILFSISFKYFSLLFVKLYKSQIIFPILNKCLIAGYIPIPIKLTALWQGIKLYCQDRLIAT